MLILLVTAAFLYLREKFGALTCWKSSICLLFLLWLTVIYFGTLGNRIEGGNFSQSNWIPFASYREALYGGNREIYRTNFMNAGSILPDCLAALPCPKAGSSIGKPC